MSETPRDDEAVLRLRQAREAFVERVRRNERLAAADPVGYRRKLRNLVLLGYAYIGAVLALALALTAALVAFAVFGHHLGTGVVKLGLILVVFLFGVLRSLWVRVERPGGLLLDRGRAPRLWREVESIADRLGAPRPDEIRLDEAFNASAAQWPRFGILGGYRSTLSLGLPLLASLSHEEALGVVAHEFGHFSGKHDRFAVWIYRVNATWDRLGENLSRGGASLFRPFVAWYNPRFAATSFALRRQHEYEADRAAAEIVGPHVVARALARLDVLHEHGRRLFWSPLESKIERGVGLAPGYFAGLPETLRQPLDENAAERRLRFSLAEPTDYDDSHPALADRLAALGEAPPDEVDPLPTLSAAEVFFGDALPGIAADLEAFFAAKMAPLWTAEADRQAKLRARLEVLERETDARPPSEDEAVEIAYLRALAAEPDEARTILKELHANLPENPHACFFLGERLVEDDDPAGVSLLKLAAERDPDVVDAARALLARFYARQGDHDAFSTLRTEAQDAHDRKVAAEGASVPGRKDELLSPDLTDGERERIRKSLEGLKGLGQAYAFRKKLPGTEELRDFSSSSLSPPRWSETIPSPTSRSSSDRRPTSRGPSRSSAIRTIGPGKSGLKRFRDRKCTTTDPIRASSAEGEGLEIATSDPATTARTSRVFDDPDVVSVRILEVRRPTRAGDLALSGKRSPPERLDPRQRLVDVLDLDPHRRRAAGLHGLDELESSDMVVALTEDSHRGRKSLKAPIEDALIERLRPVHLHDPEFDVTNVVHALILPNRRGRRLTLLAKSARRNSMMPPKVAGK